MRNAKMVRSAQKEKLKDQIQILSFFADLTILAFLIRKRVVHILGLSVFSGTIRY